MRRETVIGPAFLECDYDGAAILPIDGGVYELRKLVPESAQWTRSAHAHDVEGTRHDADVWRAARAEEPPPKLYRVRVVVELEELTDAEAQALLARKRAGMVSENTEAE